LHELREKSSKSDFLTGIFLIKLLFSVLTECFIEALYRLIQQAVPSFGSNCEQTPSSIGQLVTITFSNAYASAPQVELTPATSAASLLPVYRTTSTTGFTLNTANTPTASTTYSFSYFTVQ
jgi:hypothetical protein